MSPEQASGRPVDRRADVWSFGVVLFEMLSGTRLFDGEIVSHTLADVLRADIRWSLLPSDAPPAIRRLLERCLERDPRRRLRDIGEARIAIEDCLARSSSASFTTAPIGRSPARTTRPWLRWAAAGRLGVAVVALLTQLRPDERAAQTLEPLDPCHGGVFLARRAREDLRVKEPVEVRPCRCRPASSSPRA